MRYREIGFWCSLLAGSLACSDDSPSSDGPGLAAAGSAGAASAAGAGGLAPAPEAPAAGSGGGTSSGSSSMEGVDVSGPLDPGSGGTSGSSDDPPGAGGTGAVDAGAAPPQIAGVCPAGPFAASPLPAGGATPQVVCGGMTFTEGAVWFDSLQTLFFSDFSIGNAATNFSGPIMAYTPGGECQDFIADAGTNGLAIAPDGNLLGARHSTQTLTLFDLETRQPTVFVADNGGLAFNSPNDIAVRSDGNIYFTDPDYMRGNRPAEQPMRTYRRDPGGALSVIDEGASPNGITLSPDESRLYLSHLGFGGGGNNVLVFELDASGAVVGEPETFLNGTGSDGMAVDCAGNLYITQGGVQIFSPEGEPLGTIPAPGAANVAFGGPERRTLFITATTNLLAVELAIPGLPY